MSPLLALLLVTAEPKVLISETIQLQNDFKTCLAEQTVALGKDNSESADTVLRAASSVCAPIEANLRAHYAESPLGQAHIEKLMERDRKAGENDGVAALLKARSGR